MIYDLLLKGVRVGDFRTKAEVIVDALRARIMSGELLPKQRLVIRGLANDFSCSDIPVREALRTLSSEGLVTNVPHGGACVSALEGNELLELTETRSLLEPEATVAASRNMTTETLQRLRDLLGHLRNAADIGSALEYGRLNREFHRTILARCPNETLATLINSLWDRAERGRAVHGVFHGHVETSMAQHEQIIHQIAEHDEAALRAVCVEHSAHGLAAVRRFVEMDRQATATDRDGADAVAAPPESEARFGGYSGRRRPHQQWRR
jgi:DNA-binding GntR family transcriptional regulator